MPGVLVDSNVLVYAHDRREPIKRPRAIEVLDRLQRSGQGRLSVQCLAEFFAITTSGHKAMLTAAEAGSQAARLLESWIVFDVTPLVVTEALRGVREHRMPYWDAQMWATARLNQTTVVFSEDFSAGSVVDGVRFVNPFAKSFDIGEWL